MKKISASKNLRMWTVFSMMAIGVALPIQDAGAWGKFPGGHHPAYGGNWARHDPVEVHNVYVHHAPGGCVGCGIGVAAVAGLVGGAILGAAVAGSAPPPPPMVVAGPPIGSEVSALPPGCAAMSVNGANLYQCGPVWYQPFFGGNGVYYTVVPAP